MATSSFITVQNILFFPPDSHVCVQACPGSVLIIRQGKLGENGVDGKALAGGIRAMRLEFWGGDEGHTIMASDYINIDFFARFQSLTLELRGQILSHAPMPEVKPQISSGKTWLELLRKYAFWYGIGVYDPLVDAQANHLDPSAIFSVGKQLTKKLVSHCEFFAKRAYGNIDSLFDPSISNAHAHNKLESTGTIPSLPVDSLIQNNIRSLTIGVRLTKPEVDGACGIINGCLKNLRELRILAKLDLLCDGFFTPSSETPSHANTGTVLISSLRNIIDTALSGNPIKFEAHVIGLIAVDFGEVSANFSNSQKDWIKYLFARLHSFFRFITLADPHDHPDHSPASPALECTSLTFDPWGDEYYKSR